MLRGDYHHWRCEAALFIFKGDKIAKIGLGVITGMTLNQEDYWRLGTMKRINILAIVLMILLLLSACDSKAKSGDSALTAEADDLARQYWDSGLSKCGEFHYGRTWIRVGLPVADVIFQYKDLEIETKPGKITEADKLNGIEWKGTSYLKPSANRYYDYKTKEWTDWRNGVPSQPAVYANLIKQRGEWSVGKNIVQDRRYKKVDCGDIPD